MSMNEAADVDDSIMTTATNMTNKTAKGKKSRAKSKISIAPTTLTSSFIEPEDDDFDVKIAAQPPTRGRKRKSDNMEDPNDSEPVPKRRGTRAQGSTLKADATHDIAMEEAAEHSVIPPVKKGRKAGKTRASSTARKASAVSTASIAPLNDCDAIDAELDAALEADLVNPQTKEEVFIPAKQPAKRGRAASKAQKAKTSAVLARQQFADNPANESVAENNTIEISMVTADESIMSVAPIRNPKQRAPKAVKARTASKVLVEVHVDADAQIDAAPKSPTAEQTANNQPIPAEEVLKASKPRGRQSSRKASRQVSRAKPKKALPTSAPVVEVLDAPSVNADEFVIFKPAEEAVLAEDAPSKPKRGRKPGTTNKNKKGKAAAAPQGSTEESTIIPAETQGVEEPAIVRGIEGENFNTEVQEDSVIVQRRTEQSLTTKDAVQSSESAGSEEKLVKAATPTKSSTTAVQIPSPTPSPQPSDAENQPPSSRPSATRPPLAPLSPIGTRMALAAPVIASTPTAQRIDARVAKIATSFPWTAADLEEVFTGAEKENENERAGTGTKLATLTAVEKNMTVEEWVRWNAFKAQERLRNECERLVGRFESEGMKAMKALEGVETVDD